MGVVAGAAGALLMTIFFDVWLLAGIAISTIIAGAGVRALQAG